MLNLIRRNFHKTPKTAKEQLCVTNAHPILNVFALRRTLNRLILQEKLNACTLPQRGLFPAIL